ncbi:peptidoglycan editing factor PgeF [Thermodesulfitimonas sp.]
MQTAVMDLPWLGHAFTTRLGGVSEGPFATLNLGFTVGDVPERVLVNRRLLATALGYDPARMVAGRQVHGEKVAVVTVREAGAGACRPETALDATDGLTTSEAGLALMVFFADCVPVLLADMVKRVIAVVHAGWRGTAREITRRALGVMAANLQVAPAHCVAAIGPAIGPCCYEVDEPVAAVFRPWGEKVTWRQGDKWRVDLWEANRETLIAAGIPPEQIAVIRLCTCCHPELFFSYRRDGVKTGRMAGVIFRR